MKLITKNICLVLLLMTLASCANKQDYMQEIENQRQRTEAQRDAASKADRELQRAIRY